MSDSRLLQRGQFRILLVEDDEIMGESLCDRFELEGYDVTWLRRAEGVLDTLQITRPFHALLSDIRLPDLSGEELFKILSAQLIRVPPTVFLTGYGSIESAVELLKLGAIDYLIKPFDLDKLVEQMEQLCATEAQRVGGFEEDITRQTTSFPEIGVSPAMRRLSRLLPKVANRASAILITGESGVGKEVLAQALHTQSKVKGPLVAVNCAALPESLLEAELFGHEKGAFTGANRRRKGVFEQAIGGVLFLDEIGDMPLDMQSRLLRVVQERRVTPLGAESSIEVPVQLICATNRDLRQLVNEGQFREDLYYRINIVQLHIPPLRERREDIPWLADRLLAEIALREDEPIRTLSSSALQALLKHDWPGNVRELKHSIERAVIFSECAQLQVSDFFDISEPLTDSVTPNMPEAPAGDALGVFLKGCEREYIERMLITHEWKIIKTAQMLGISRKCLWEKMRRYEICEPSIGNRAASAGVFTPESSGVQKWTSRNESRGGRQGG